jgi:excinuclease ABC subunit C
VSDLRAAVAALPLAPGAYRFRDATGRALYIGRARQLRHRVRSYWGDLSDRPGLSAMVRRIAAIEAVVCDSDHEAAWLERNLLQTAKPRWNRIEGGTEVVGFIRLDDRAGLRFEHMYSDSGGGRCFGPYLGGLRIRTAISALDRVLPLSYVGGAASGGSAAAFAALRGIGGADRVALVDATVAVLEREPAATDRVRSELIRRRDRAAAEQRYEFAGTLQRELEALDWITAEQKVMIAGVGDAEVAGWADGVLVRFGIRAGRMSNWTQRPAGEAAARGPLDRTPAPWREFARRNAELAAALLAARDGAG